MEAGCLWGISLPGDRRDRLHRWPPGAATARPGSCRPGDGAKPDKLASVAWRDRAEVVRGDLGDPDSLTTAFDGIDVVYYLVHSMGTSPDFVAEEARSARNVVAAARRAGVKRLVYLSGLHPAGRRPVPASAVAHGRRRHSARVRHRERRATGRDRHRFGFGFIRDDPAPDRPAPGDDGPEVGAQQDSTDRYRRRAALPDGGAPPRGCRRRAPGISAARTCWSTARRCRSTPRWRGCEAADRRAAVAHTDHRELVGGSGDADAPGFGATARRVAGMRCGHGQFTTSMPSSHRRPAASPVIATPSRMRYSSGPLPSDPEWAGPRRR